MSSQGLPVLGLVIEAFILIGLCTLFYQLLRQQGRILLRLDELEQKARFIVAETERKRLPGERSLAESRIERSGLKSGTPAPGFRLPDLSGRMVSLKDYRGRRLLLIFTDPHCAPCDQVAPELVQLHRQQQANGLALVMVGRGDAEENRKKAEQNGLDFPVLLQERWELSKQYGMFATPVAFLINEQGVIARDVAIGADAILKLAQDALLASHASRV